MQAETSVKDRDGEDEDYDTKWEDIYLVVQSRRGEVDWICS